MTTYYIKSMQGIGDQLYQYPFVKHLAKNPSNTIFMQTVLPELYNECNTGNIKFVRPPEKTYRTQQKHIDGSAIEFVDDPINNRVKIIEPFYTGADLINDSIISAMARKFELTDEMTHIKYGLKDDEYNCPYVSDPKQLSAINDIILNEAAGRPIAIVRPSTIRREWVVLTRSPKPQYISWCAKVLMESGYYVISIADLNANDEWLENDESPPAHKYLHKGELGVLGTLELIKKSDVVVGGSGFIVPAAISFSVPLFVIFGGRMSYDSPYKILHPSMDLKKVGWAMPDNPCRCTYVKHTCDKTISKLDSDFMHFLQKIQS